MLSRETTVTWVGVGVGLVVLYVAAEFTSLPDLAIVALVAVVGLVVPALLNARLDR